MRPKTNGLSLNLGSSLFLLLFLVFRFFFQEFHSQAEKKFANISYYYQFANMCCFFHSLLLLLPRESREIYLKRTFAEQFVPIIYRNNAVKSTLLLMKMCSCCTQQSYYFIVMPIHITTFNGNERTHSHVFGLLWMVSKTKGVHIVSSIPNDAKIQYKWIAFRFFVHGLFFGTNLRCICVCVVDSKIYVYVNGKRLGQFR